MGSVRHPCRSAYPKFVLLNYGTAMSVMPAVMPIAESSRLPV